MSDAAAKVPVPANSKVVVKTQGSGKSLPAVPVLQPIKIDATELPTQRMYQTKSTTTQAIEPNSGIQTKHNNIPYIPYTTPAPSSKATAKGPDRFTGVVSNVPNGVLAVQQVAFDPVQKKTGDTDIPGNGKYNLANAKGFNNIKLPGTTIVQRKEHIVQRLTGAAAPIAGHDEILPGVAASRGEAALQIANYINLRARETTAADPVAGTPAVHAASSELEANNGGNLYVRSNYTVAGPAAASLETWSELTNTGGGYAKRIRIIENGNTIMDRVMNDPAPTALNAALTVDAGPGGVHQYGSVHAANGADAGSLDISNADERSADNITKVVAEGARFGWLAQGLSDGTVGNTTNGIFKVTIRVPQIGRFTMDPTFQALWGAWRSAFGRKFMRDKDAAVAILRDRMIEGWTRSPGAPPGAAPLEDKNTAQAQVTSLTKGGVVKAVPCAVGVSNGAAIMTALGMTFFSAD